MRDGLQEGHSVNFLLVPVPSQEVFSLDHAYLHDVADVQVRNPLRLIQKAEDVSHVGFSILRVQGCIFG